MSRIEQDHHRDTRPCHGWGDEARRVKCVNCGEPINAIYDPELRVAHDECGGYPHAEWADGMRRIVEEIKAWRKKRGIR